jgi:hypothetical protein
MAWLGTIALGEESALRDWIANNIHSSTFAGKTSNPGRKRTPEAD